MHMIRWWGANSPTVSGCPLVQSVQRLTFVQMVLKIRNRGARRLYPVGVFLPSQGAEMSVVDENYKWCVVNIASSVHCHFSLQSLMIAVMSQPFHCFSLSVLSPITVELCLVLFARVPRLCSLCCSSLISLLVFSSCVLWFFSPCSFTICLKPVLCTGISCTLSELTFPLVFFWTQLNLNWVCVEK